MLNYNNSITELNIALPIHSSGSLFHESTVTPMNEYKYYRTRHTPRAS